MAANNDLEQMQALFPDARPSDLGRFFRAHKFNLKVATAKYTNCLEWRRESRPNDIPRDEVHEILKTRVFYQLPGVALDGSSVVVFHGPNHQPKRFSTLQTIRAILYVVSDIFEKQRSVDDPRITLLIYAPKGTPVDLSGLKQLATTFADYYPETLSKALVFPIGFATPYLWSAAKLFLDPRTANKVHLLPDGGKPPTLLEHLAESSIPSRFYAGARDHKDEPALLPHLDLQGSKKSPEILPAALIEPSSPIEADKGAVQRESPLPALTSPLIPPPAPRRSVLIVAVGASLAWAMTFKLELPSGTPPAELLLPSKSAPTTSWLRASLLGSMPLGFFAALVLLIIIVVPSRKRRRLNHNQKEKAQ